MKKLITLTLCIAFTSPLLANTHKEALKKELGCGCSKKKKKKKKNNAHYTLAPKAK